MSESKRVTREDIAAALDTVPLMLTGWDTPAGSGVGAFAAHYGTGAPSLVPALADAIFDALPVPSDDTAGVEAALVKALDYCEPRYEGGSPNPTNGGSTAFSGWYVPDYLMQRLRAALARSAPPETPAP